MTKLYYIIIIYIILYNYNIYLYIYNSISVGSELFIKCNLYDIYLKLYIKNGLLHVSVQALLQNYIYVVGIVYKLNSSTLD